MTPALWRLMRSLDIKVLPENSAYKHRMDQQPHKNRGAVEMTAQKY